MSRSVPSASALHTGQLGPKYRAILPRAVREALHVTEGDTLLYLVDGEQVRITTRRQLAQEIYGSLAEEDGRDFTHEISAERQAEAQHEKP